MHSQQEIDSMPALAVRLELNPSFPILQAAVPWQHP
jgi:hypothetical protein